MNPKILIIGAGASGFSTAIKLIASGYENVLILEAENRIGGRINTVPFGANFIELGAQWCHGEDDNSVFKLTEGSNLLSSNSVRNEKFLLIESNGEQVATSTYNKLFDLTASILDSSTDDSAKSIGQIMERKLNELIKTGEHPDINDELSQKFLNFFNEFISSFNGCENYFDLSPRTLTEYQKCEGDLLLNWKDKGYVTLFDLLKKKYLTGKNVCIEDKILFGKEVIKISYDIFAIDKSNTHTVRVQCSDGSCYDVDHIICTTSLGVLKEQHLQWFHPPLPMPKVNAIEGLSIGATGKIFIEFEKPFWPSDWLGFGLLWNARDLATIRQNPKWKWLLKVYRILTIDFQPNVLMGRISAPTQQMEETTETSIIEGFLMLLNMFLPSWKISDVVGMKRTNWSSNPHFRGASSFYSIKSDEMNVSRKDLIEPINDSMGNPIIQFAGEAAHIRYYSTVHGAVESGYREAQRLIDLYENK